MFFRKKKSKRFFATNFRYIYTTSEYVQPSFRFQIILLLLPFCFIYFSVHICVSVYVCVFLHVLRNVKRATFFAAKILHNERMCNFPCAGNLQIVIVRMYCVLYIAYFSLNIWRLLFIFQYCISSTTSRTGEFSLRQKWLCLLASLLLLFSWYERTRSLALWIYVKHHHRHRQIGQNTHSNEKENRMEMHIVKSHGSRAKQINCTDVHHHRWYQYVCVCEQR